MALTLVPTTAAERLEELELTVRHLSVLADAAPLEHRAYLVCEAIALDDDLWRLQLRGEVDRDTSLDGDIERLERDIAQLREHLDDFDQPPDGRPLRVVPEPVAA